MTQFAMVFPGQGSQTVGMLADLAATNPLVEKTFREASDALGYDLWQLVQQGPAEELNKTWQLSLLYWLLLLPFSAFGRKKAEKRRQCLQGTAWVSTVRWFVQVSWRLQMRLSWLNCAAN